MKDKIYMTKVKIIKLFKKTGCDNKNLYFKLWFLLKKLYFIKA